MMTERDEEYTPAHLPIQFKMLRYVLILNYANSERFKLFFEQMSYHKQCRFKTLAHVIAQTNNRYFEYSNIRIEKIRALFSAIEACRKSF